MSRTQQGTLFVISAPSGTGKSTLSARLVSEVDGLSFSVSYTTRERRAEEADGRDYHFVDEASFRSMIEAGSFLEWARVFGNFYGTGAEETRRALGQGHDLLLDIDVQGAAQVRANHPEAVSVFVMPPDFGTLRGRLESRAREQRVEIERRLEVSRAEVGEYPHYRYLVINDDLETAVAELRAIVAAERARVERRRPLAEAIAGTFPPPPEQEVP